MCRRSLHGSELVLLCGVLFAALAPPLRGEEQQDKFQDLRPGKYQELIDQVKARLLDHVQPVKEFDVWPPEVGLDKSDDFNAYATAYRKNGKRIPVVRITPLMMKLVILRDGDPDPQHAADRLGFILGHELSHLTLGHITVPTLGDTALVKKAFSRQQETDADLAGMKLALEAGYSFRYGRGAVERMLKIDYSSFEALAVDHPSWKDRLTIFDKEKASLWGAMSAFHNGFYFLGSEQYASAIPCFEAVVKEFPDCTEGWANLGYAYLMRWCDALDAQDLLRLDIGQVAVGSFYSRSGTLDEVARGGDPEDWKRAVAALRKSLVLKPDQVLARANLGVAYLVSPDGRDLVKAAKELEPAAEAALKDTQLEAWMRASVLNNAAVADLAANRIQPAARKLQSAAEQLDRQFKSKSPREIRPVLRGLDASIYYNEMLLLAGTSDSSLRRKALTGLEKYLNTLGPGSAWWQVAYEHYSKLCTELNVASEPQRLFMKAAGSTYRPVTSVTLPSGAILVLSEHFGAVKKQLGEGQSQRVLPESDQIVRMRYPNHGVDLIVQTKTDRILAVHLNGAKAPHLPLRGVGLGSQVVELRIGMTGDEVQKTLADESFDFRYLEDPMVSYRFYPNLGLAVKIRKDRVEELAVAQVARRQPIQDY